VYDECQAVCEAVQAGQGLSGVYASYPKSRHPKDATTSMHELKGKSETIVLQCAPVFWVFELLILSQNTQKTHHQF
jgi:hypothetical protein